MTLESLKDKVSEANRLLDSNQVADAFVILEEMAQDEGNYLILDNLKSLKQTYGYMIHYLIEGMEDATRPEVYDNTVCTLREIGDCLLTDKLTSDSPEIYFSTTRICKHQKLSFLPLWTSLMDIESKLQLALSVEADSTLLFSEKDRVMRSIFDLVWTERNSKDLCVKLVEKVLSSSVDKKISLYLISALVLSLLVCYDREKMIALIDIYDNSISEEIAARALVGIVMALRKHGSRVENDKKILGRLELWQDSLVTYSRLQGVVKEIIRTRDTDRVTAKMRDEVIPELMKMRPDMLKKMRDSAMDFESGMLENNPQWEEMLEENGIADKMRELTEMQSEGADLMMVTFSNLKGFPFFNNVSSWFMPFDINNPSIRIERSNVKSLETMLSMGNNMCDSDKYSLIFAFSAMPEQQRQMMVGQFDQQLSQMTEEFMERLEKRSNPEFNMETVVFIRELYRFFRLFRKKEEFADPFLEPFDFLNLPIIGDMMADEDLIELIGEFYFKRGYYKEALNLFKAVEESKYNTPSYWEKVGFAYQSLKSYDKALSAYHRSELIAEPGSWLLKKLAFVNKKLGNYAVAAEYYSKALVNDPDNVLLIMNAGYTLFESGDVQAAVRSYYHANYLDPENVKIWRAIGWTEFVMGNLDKSSSYYAKILALSPDSVDYLNAGHVKLASKNFKEAIMLYKKSSEYGFKDFETAFRADADTLEKSGVDKLTQDLIIDSIKMSTQL